MKSIFDFKFLFLVFFGVYFIFLVHQFVFNNSIISILMLYFIFTRNFGNLYLYPLPFRISKSYSFSTSILSTDMINVDSFLTDNSKFYISLNKNIFHMLINSSSEF